jgi:hypothetical protein
VINAELSASAFEVKLENQHDGLGHNKTSVGSRSRGFYMSLSAVLIRPLIYRMKDTRYIRCFFSVAQCELVGAPAPTERVLGRVYY